MEYSLTDIISNLNWEERSITKRLLILSLGTGQIQKKVEGKVETVQENSAEDSFQELKEGNYRYRTANYIIDEKKFDVPFVGEALISSFEPDEIVIVGTIRSMWEAIFYRFSEGMQEEKRKKTFAEIWDICNHNEGCNTPKNELDEKQEILNKLLSRVVFSKFVKKPKVHAILMEYGPNVSENENYKRICGMKEVMQQMKADKIEVAFDITHSFRSIPIYNLTVLNYMKALGNYKIDISHIYYGNLDISRECDFKSPIEKLDYLMKIMNLTGALETFRETGNVKNLILEYEKAGAEREIIDALKQYEWATQSNSYKEIEKALRNLLCKKIQSQSPIINDAQDMLADILKNHFGELLLDESNTIEKHTMMQYKLASLYYQQHQYGLALATGMEAYRGVFVQLYQENSKNEENDRRNAIAKLHRAAEGLPEDNILSLVSSSIIKAKPIRDQFAHCLDADQKKNKDYTEDYSKDLAAVKTFFDIFVRFMDIRENDRKLRKEYEQDYNRQLNIFSIVKKDVKIRKKRFIVTEKMLNEDDLKRFARSNNNEYDVEQLEEKDYEEIKNQKNSTEKIKQRCKIISERLSKKEQDIMVVLYLKRLNEAIKTLSGLQCCGVRQTLQIYDESTGNYYNGFTFINFDE